MYSIVASHLSQEIHILHQLCKHEPFKQLNSNCLSPVWDWQFECVGGGEGVSFPLLGQKEESVFQIRDQSST